ncbi:allophanate hydrolase subunit 1 [Thalassococcus sp. S3]|uniref:5-oxoprolinase subunit B family protein n=1 Tax=Thalassococcus sp. S3 TaxID=2017482 RepID=UPI00102447BA|nr:carboxyltransferase domain-containing protein [Thalassococcus sp. S3]QBF31073.1 allophanate hydrolase [Thalassococcus sp. S3]
MPQADAPLIRSVGLSGLLVTFAERLSEEANRAAIAFRAAIDAEGWAEVEETSSTLTSTFLSYDPLGIDESDLRTRLRALLAERDWMAAPYPAGCRLWTIPCVFGTDLAPQLGDAAKIAGMSEADAIRQLTAARPRVLTLGFAPGQPYLGQLDPAWDIPRQSAITSSVPEGALVLAIRQFVLFATSAPTGWRHVGQTAFKGYRPSSDTPFALSPGDAVQFRAIRPEELEEIRSYDTTGDGGATTEPLEI